MPFLSFLASFSWSFSCSLSVVSFCQCRGSVRTLSAPPYSLRRYIRGRAIWVLSVPMFVSGREASGVAFYYPFVSAVFVDAPSLG